MHLKIQMLIKPASSHIHKGLSENETKQIPTKATSELSGKQAHR